jgi:hypothetical protein
VLTSFFWENLDDVFEMSLCVGVCKAWKTFEGELVWLGKFDRIKNPLVEVKTSLMEGGLTWVELTGLGS